MELIAQVINLLKISGLYINVDEICGKEIISQHSYFKKLR